jgi:hypothetical protein
MLDLAIAARYVARLLANRRIARYLDDNHPEIAKEFEAVASAVLSESVHQPGLRAESSSHEETVTGRVEAPAVCALSSRCRFWCGDLGQIKRYRFYL